jgi:hypothetical protein
MDESLSEWLTLREAADWAARAERLTDIARKRLASADPVRALDLCTGRGSNVRYLMSRLPRHQRWLAVDRDPELLGELPVSFASWATTHHADAQSTPTGCRIVGDGLSVEIEWRLMDLAVLPPELFEGRHLVTASALLDLVSESWLRVLAARCRHVGAAALFTLSYDGRSSCDPVEPADELIRTLMNLHQKRDKGLGGLAAGPDAWVLAERAFQEAGYTVDRAASPWSMGPGDHRFQQLLIEGWAGAACEMAPEQSTEIGRWLQRRLEHVQAGRSRIVVHHHDMVAWLDAGTAS